MNHSMITSVVSMQGLQQKLDVIAGNMANADTNGYKRKEASFHDVLTATIRQEESFQQPGRLTPLGLTQGWGARLSQIQTLMEQGALKETHQPYDLAIEGDALFEVRTAAIDPSGQAVQRTAWTRDGSFTLVGQPADPDNLYLATKDGYLVMGVDDEPIPDPAGYRFQVDADGTVNAYRDTNSSAEPQAAGRLKLVQIIRPQLLRELGNNLYMLPEDQTVQGGEVLRVIDAAAEDGRIAVRQGFLEQSNVSLAEEMTELMMTQRALQFNARALSSSDNLMQMANALRG